VVLLVEMEELKEVAEHAEPTYLQLSYHYQF
jgi:hypothetical protein